MQDSVYHMTLKSHFISNSAPKHRDFAIRKCNVFMDVCMALLHSQMRRYMIKILTICIANIIFYT